MIASLFESLDLDHDGFISRQELYTSATAMEWGWQEAPLFAVLDLFTIRGPLSKERFSDYIEEITTDSLGPYGRVLRHAPLFDPNHGIRKAGDPLTARRSPVPVSHGRQALTLTDRREADLAVTLEEMAGPGVAAAYRRLLSSLEEIRCAKAATAVLLIDPQRSFTSGAWMQSIGAQALEDVVPIRQALAKCSVLLENYYHALELMFTRCPFPPASYAWDECLNGTIDPAQLYFIKPGNSVLFPPHNGFKEWVGCCLRDGINVLLMGGCTLNSCVRVSAIETQAFFLNQNLQVVVDLSLSGARLRNYVPGPQFGGLSAVESAVRQMLSAGVQVVNRVNWC